MKKVLKVLLISILAVCMCVPFVGCTDNGGSNSDPGLKVKKISGVYTIYDYVQEDGVTELDIGAKLEKGVTNVRIRKGAFEGNSKLTKIIVPDTVTEIDAGAFQKMGALVSLELPFIGKTAVSDAYLKETASDENKSINSERTIAHLFGTDEYDAGVAISISYDSASETTCYVPYTFNTVIVNATADYSIPMYAFCGAINLTKIELKGKIDAIGEHAFDEIKELTAVELPATVKNIYAGAFMNCKKLNSLTFGSGAALTEVKKDAFVNTALKDTALDGVITLTADQKAEIFGE